MNLSIETVSSSPKDPGELISNISKLMAEAEEMLSESTSHHAEESLALFQERRAALEEGWRARCSEALAQVGAAVKQADATVRTHPYKSLVVALGIGVLIGTGLSLTRHRSPRPSVAL